jgi:DNA-binding Lrp family transcriptional regulator
MRRGNALEDLDRQVYLKRYGAVVDHDAMRAMAHAQKRLGYEFMVGNPDDIVIKDGKRFVVDYKVPSAFSEDVEFDYEIQLHHYATLANIAGIRIDGLELAKLDLPPQMSDYLTNAIDSISPQKMAQIAASIVQMDIPGCRVVAIPVELKKSLQAEMLAAGKDCWNDYVIKGEVPTPLSRGKLELSESITLDLARYQQQYLMAKSGISHLESKVKVAQEKIGSLLQEVDFEGKTLPWTAVNVKPNALDPKKLINEALSLGATEQELHASERTYSIKALLDEIQTRGGRADADHLYDGYTLDAAKAEAFLKEKGVDMSSLRKDGISVVLSRKKEDQEIVDLYKANAKERFDSWIEESLISDGDDEFSGVDPDTEPYMPIEMGTGHLKDAFVSAVPVITPDDGTTHKHPMRAIGLR